MNYIHFLEVLKQTDVIACVAFDKDFKISSIIFIFWFTKAYLHAKQWCH
jgi:hypothetical protein